MGRKLKNLLKRKNKGEKANKRKLTTHHIEVLFDTGTSGPYAPSIPTTSAASNADPMSNAPAAANDSVLPKTSETSLSFQRRKNSTRPSSDKSDVIIKKLEEMTKTLSCELAEMTASNDLARKDLTEAKGRLQPLSKKKCSTVSRRPQPPSAQGDQIKMAMLQKSAFIKQEKGALDMPTCTSHVADKAVQFTQTDSAIQTFDGMDGASPSDKTLGGKQDNSNLEDLLARCLGVMEQKSSMKDKEQLVKEIREALGRDEMTKSHDVLTAENINLQEWQKTAAKRPFARKGLVKMLRDEYQSQSLYTDTSDDDDADSFVSAVSSVSSLASISDNIHQMELLDDVKLLTEGKQHKSIGWVLVQEDALTKLTEAVHHLTSLLANLSTPYQRSSATKTLTSLAKDNTTITSPQYPNYRPQPFNLPHCGMTDHDKNRAPPPTPEMSPLPNFPIPSPELFGQTLVRCLERMSAIAYSSQPSDFIPPPSDETANKHLPSRSAFSLHH